MKKILLSLGTVAAIAAPVAAVVACGSSYGIKLMVDVKTDDKDKNNIKSITINLSVGNDHTTDAIKAGIDQLKLVDGKITTNTKVYIHSSRGYKEMTWSEFKNINASNLPAELKLDEDWGKDNNTKRDYEKNTLIIKLVNYKNSSQSNNTNHANISQTNNNNQPSNNNQVNKTPQTKTP